MRAQKYFAQANTTNVKNHDKPVKNHGLFFYFIYNSFINNHTKAHNKNPSALKNILNIDQ
jgi:hypothetical protein